MQSFANDRIKNIIKRDQLHPFDFVNNPLFYDPKPAEGTEYVERLRAQTKMAYVTSNECSQGLKFVFIPGAMSNGWLAYKIAQNYKDKIRAATKARYGTSFLSTQNLKHYIAPKEMMERVILPNRDANFAFIDKVERLFPDMSVIGPIDFEGPLRTQRGNNALSQGATFQDWTFESWWVPRVIDCHAMVLGLDHAYSRYGGMEELTGSLIQCGFLDSYRKAPGKTFDIVDQHGNPITLSDRAWERARHIVDVVENGFRTDLAVAVLMAEFQIHDWLEDIKNSPLESQKIHPVLAQRHIDDVSRIKALKVLMLPYIANKCANWLPYEQDPNLKAYFNENIKQYTGQDYRPDIKDILFAYQPLGGFAHPEHLLPAQTHKESLIKDSFSFSGRQAKRRGTDGVYFNNPATIFDDHHFDQLSVWEQAALPFLIGCAEAQRMPEKAPRALFYACDPKGGNRAKEWSEIRGIDWIKEAQSSADPIDDKDSFYNKVITPNVKEAQTDQRHFSKTKKLFRQGIGSVVSTLNMLNIDNAVQEHRNFVAAHGADRLSSRARLALMMEHMDRNSQGLLLRKGWEYSPDDTQLMLRSVLHATGLIEPPYEGGRYRSEIFLYAREEGHNTKQKTFQKQDLYDLFMPLANVVRKGIDATPAVPLRETYLACARLIQIIDMAIDPAGMNYQNDKPIIDWRNVDADLTWFLHTDREKKEALLGTRSEIRQKLLDVGVLFFKEEDLKDLHEDFTAAWNKARGIDSLLKRRHFEQQQLGYRQNGPA